jgi:hypothetical protein
MTKLISQTGLGFGYSKEKGQFEVKYEKTIKSFSELSKAIEFYQSLEIPSAIWDVTSMPELLDSKDFVKEDI